MEEREDVRWKMEDGAMINLTSDFRLLTSDYKLPIFRLIIIFATLWLKQTTNNLKM
jgi:hypothetical protein